VDEVVARPGIGRLCMVVATDDEVVAWCGVGFIDTLGRCKRT